MPIFKYKVKDKEGKVLEGKMEASDARTLRKKLDENGYFILEYSEKSSGKDLILNELFSVSKKTSLEDISIFSWQLYTMLNSGLTLTNTLSIIANQTKKQYLKDVFNTVGRRVQEGMSFSEALREHPKVFSRLYVQMVAAGEVGGVLDEMLRRMAVYYEEQAKIRSKVKLAMIYPMFLIIIAVSVVFFLVTFVLPRFKLIFDEMGLVIPWSTRFLLSLSAFLRGNWLMLIVAGLGLYLLAKVYTKTKSGKYRIDTIKLKAPIIGELITKTTAARFAQTLSILVSGGIPILTCLEVVTDVIDNSVVVKVMNKVSAMVGEGKSIAKPLEESKIFPEMVVSMIRVGEETGSLEEMLIKISEFYNREV